MTHLHLGVDQPLHLQSVGRRDEDGRDARGIQGRGDLSGLLSSVDRVTEPLPQPFVPVQEERVSGVGFFDRARGHHGEELGEPGNGDVASDHLEESVEVVAIGGLALVLLLPAVEDGDEQLFLGAEVVQQPGLAEIRRFGELADRGLLVSVLREDGESGPQDLFPFRDAFRIRSPRP